MLLESILEAVGMRLQLLLLRPLVLFLIHCRADSLRVLPSLVTLPLSVVFSIPFTSSVRLIAARSTDFAGSSGKEGVSEHPTAWGRKETAVNPLLIQGKNLPGWEKQHEQIMHQTGLKNLWWENKDARSAERSLENSKLKWAVQW